MKKTAKYINPIIFAVGFLVFWYSAVNILNATSSGDGYGALGMGMLFLFAWIFIVIPVYCIRYSKHIAGGKLSFLFGIYNCVLVIVSHHLPFGYIPDAHVSIYFSVWVAVWGLVPLAWRIRSRKYDQEVTKEIESEPQPDSQEKVIRIFGIISVSIYIVSLVISREFGEFIILQNFPYILPLLTAILVLVALIYESKDFWLKKQLYPIAFGAEAIYYLIMLISSLGNIQFYITKPIFIIQMICMWLRFIAIILMFIGSLNDFKRVSLLKYGAAASMVLLAVSQIGVMIYILRFDSESFIRMSASIMFYAVIFTIAVRYKQNGASRTSPPT